MNCCCQNIYRMCEVLACDGSGLILPFSAAAEDSYTLELDFNGGLIRESKEFIAGQAFNFPKDRVNENYTFTGRVKNGSNVVQSFTIEGVEYDCFQFTTVRQLRTVTATESPTPE